VGCSNSGIILSHDSDIGSRDVNMGETAIRSVLARWIE
jgi:hypothetical protein